MCVFLGRAINFFGPSLGGVAPLAPPVDPPMGGRGGGKERGRGGREGVPECPNPELASLTWDYNPRPN